MKRALIPILLLLISGVVVYGGVESKDEAVATGSSGGGSVNVQDAAVADSGDASGEVTAVLFGEETADEATLSASLRLSHETAETGVVVTLDASVSSGFSILLYEWDLDGDGIYDATTGEPTLAHAFAEDGSYGIRVRVTDDRGATAESDVVELVVLNRPPTAGFSVVSASQNDTATYEFQDGSSDPDGEIVRWLWDFGDGAVSDVPNPVHAYADDGTYFVTLVVTDEDGDESVPVVRAFTVENAEPVAAFALASDVIVAGESVRFVDASIDPSPNGSIIHVAWDFGDGSYRAGGPSADNVYAHTYASAGIFTVTLYVIDDDGAMSSVQQIVTVM